MPSFARGPMQLSAGGSFTNGASTYGGSVGFGAPRSPYGTVGLTTTD